MTDPLFIRACLNQPTERTPVWIMRQAGRYLPQYREIRKKNSFSTMYKTPDLATEVTLLPVDLLGVDAAILFSDILVVPEAMGMELNFLDNRGPVFSNPVRNEDHLKRLSAIESDSDLDFVIQAVKQIKATLKPEIPLIGFCGAPWTLATYMIEGAASKKFNFIKEWRFNRPDLLDELLNRITNALINYCSAQIDAGAQAIQIFDSWAGLLDADGYEQFAIKYVRKLIRSIRRPNVPIIYFPKGGMLWLEKTLSVDADVIGLDWNIAPSVARSIVGNAVALQGNLDPTALYAQPDKIQHYTLKMLEAFGDAGGHIANLGHGILPDIPVEHAAAFVDTVKNKSAQFHKTNAMGV